MRTGNAYAVKSLVVCNISLESLSGSQCLWQDKRILPESIKKNPLLLPAAVATVAVDSFFNA